MSDAAVVIWGELLWDRFVDELDTARSERLGGAPANVAWHLAQAGGWARLVTRVGDDDDGRRAVAQLAAVSIDTSLVQVDPERATGEVGITLHDGEPRYRLFPGRAWERIACTDAARGALADADVLIYGTLAQRTDDGLAGWRAAHAAAPSSCMRVCDLNLRRDDQHGVAIDEALAAADVIKLNDRELASLREWLGWSDPVATLRRGDARRPRVVAVTHGADGSTLHGPDSTIEVPAIASAPGGDNIGCGDSYLAILVYGLTAGWDLATCGAAASRWAAAVAGARGATPTFSDDQIADLLEAA